MIPASPEFKTILRTALEAKASYRTLAEWNMNRYYTPVVSNNGEADQDDFPLASVVEPRRPTKGIVKMRIDEGFIQPQYMNAVPAARFYITSEDDLYRYWSSLTKTNAFSGGSYVFAAAQNLTALYPSSIYTNKIVIGLETSLAKPVNFTVKITTNGTTWTTVATNPTINSDGQVVLYLQANNSWSSTPYYNNVTQISGVRLSVSSMDEPDSRLSVIEISPRIHNDVSDYLVNWDASFEISDTSNITPIGRASSNVASVTLSNTDLRFNNDNSASLYFGLMDKNVKITGDFGLLLSGGSYEYVRQFTMYTDTISPGDDMTVSIGLKDSSMYMQGEKIPALYLEGHTIGSIIWKLMDIAGFTNYFYNVKQDDSQIIPFFWTQGDKNLWDEIAGLAETTQTAVYFDENDVMLIRTKSSAFDVGRPVDWDLRATSVPGLEANIESLSPERVFDANSVDVKYYNTAFSDFNNGLPKMDVVWEVEDTVLLRATTLKQSLTSSSEWLVMQGAKALVWPYSGIVNIEGEIIRYEGKDYYYYDKNGVLTHETIKTDDEKKVIDSEKSSETLAWKNYFSGWLKITKRGEYGTQVKDHLLYNYIPLGNGPRYAGSLVRFDNITARTSYGSSFDNDSGTLLLTAWPNATWWDIFLVENQWPQDKLPAQNARWGTRVKFQPNGYPESMGEAGLHFMGGYNGTGLYASIHPSISAKAGGWPEIWLVLKHRDGHSQTLAQVEANIQKDVWYDLEVDTRWAGGTWHTVVYLNGQPMITSNIVSSYWDNDGRTGAFIRGNCRANFENLYAFEADANDPEVNTDDSGQILDLIYGGYRSNHVISQYKLGPGGQVTNLKNYFDEFTPIIHEMREFDVKFTETPVIHSYGLCSNESQVAFLEYNADPFGAKFVLANTSRVDAVVNGEDDITFGKDDVVNHKLMVYGRLLTQEDAQSVVTEDEESIRKRGKSEIEIDSKWNQSKAAADSISSWIVKYFGFGSEEVSGSIFGNPLLQIGDLVTVSHPAYNMTSSTHKYFVTSVHRSADEGYGTEVGLRRIKI